MNPFLPRVIDVHRAADASAGAALVLDLHVPPDLAHFSGHFPGLPILPGVVQLDWAVRFAREHFAITSGASLLQDVKFLAIVRPDARLALSLRHDAARQLVAFSFAAGGRNVSSGRVVFGASA